MAKRKSRKSTARRKTSGKSKSRRAQSKRKVQAAPAGVSLDRKLDIVGVVLALAGLLTLLSLLSSSRGSLTGFWVSFLGRAFGWGAYLLPLGLLAAGAWLLLRNFERAPQVEMERVLGVLLLYLHLLVTLHFLSFPADSAAAFALASEGGGGGYLGGGLFVLLRSGLGAWGAGIALFAWLVIALALTLDLSVPELFRWVRPLLLSAQDWWDERRNRNGLPFQPSPPSPQGDFAPTSPEAPPPDAGQPEPQTPRVTLGVRRPPPDSGQQAPEWKLPQVGEMLDAGSQAAYDEEHDRQRARLIEETLSSFGAPAHVVEVHRGPAITQFGVEPDFIEGRGGRTRVRVGKIASLADDLALALAAARIRIQAPVPGKGYVGIEVPNEQVSVVALRDVIESEAFRRLSSPLRFALGQDVAGNAVAADLAAMPHLLIAGATGSGKSVSVNALIACLLLHNTPETLRFIMVDPKRVELTGYNGIPHLLAPVVVELQRVVGVLQWVTREMDSRYHKFAEMGARNISDYNQRLQIQNGERMPYLVVVIDELADLMMVAPDQTERLVTRMAQLARATGIHLVISTQRPSVDVVTGLIKANVPARISFATASGVDSRVILDQLGAERLLGRGDMLFQAPDAPAPVRLQGVFVSDPEILRLVQYWRGFAGTTATAPVATSSVPGAPPPDMPLKQMAIWEQMQEMQEEEEQDDLFEQAVAVVRGEGRASVSMLQRNLRIGYTRAARLIESMEARGVVSPPRGGAHHRDILDWGEAQPPEGED